MTVQNNLQLSRTKLLSVARLSVAIGFAMLGANALQADTVFSDGTFSLSNYSIATYQTGGATINVTQTPSGGDPGAALDISTSVPSPLGESFNSRSYVVNNNFLYNPSASGAVSAIGVSVDINRLFTGQNPSLVGFSPVIYQDGNYYAYYTIVTSYAPGVYQLSSATLLPNQFDLITNLSTGAVDAAMHPNPGGDPFQLGFSASLVASGVSQPITATALYDNLNFDLQSAAPEPSVTAVLGLSLIALPLYIRKRVNLRKIGL